MIENRSTKKKIYFWNLLGNLAAAAVSVVYLLIVTRLQPAEVADHYSLATSVGNLWVIIGLVITTIFILVLYLKEKKLQKKKNETS